MGMAAMAISELPALDRDSGAVNIIVETPKGARTKFKYDDKSGLFQFDKPLPYGHTFPFEFGFLPSTLGDDGDPLDILVLSEEPTFPGCLIVGRLLGAIEAEQSQGKKTNRNDRFIAIPLNAKTKEPVPPKRTLDDELAAEITKFFVSYNELQGKKFRALRCTGPEHALELIQKGIERAREEKRKKKDGQR